MVGPVNDNRVGGRDIEPGLDNGRAQQHIHPVVHEVQHDRFQLAFPHLAVGNRQGCLGYKRP